MESETRLFERFDDIGRIEAPELCPLAGVLENISRTGCKISYKYPVAVDLENDYELKITFARTASNLYHLICHPMWIREEDGCTEIGFKILPSKDYSRLSEYVKKLNMEYSDENLNEIKDSGVLLI